MLVLSNPYLDFYLGLPASFKRDSSMPPSATEWLSPDWLALKAALARHFAWAVPTEAAIETMRRYAGAVVEIGAGSGYWAWLLRQAGMNVAAYDSDPPRFTWSRVDRGGDAAVRDHPDKTLFLCWPPWASTMGTNALEGYCGEYVFYVGEWMGGSAEPRFFALLTAQFEAIDGAAIPQWHSRDDRLFVFRRRGPGGSRVRRLCAQ